MGTLLVTKIKRWENKKLKGDIERWKENKHCSRNPVWFHLCLNLKFNWKQKYKITFKITSQLGSV